MFFEIRDKFDRGQYLDLEAGNAVNGVLARWRGRGDGFRYHTRAYCCTDATFKDSRILEMNGTRPSAVRAESDKDWCEHVSFEIAPHPALSPTQKKVISLDYGMRGNKAKITVRRALPITHLDGSALTEA